MSTRTTTVDSGVRPVPANGSEETVVTATPQARTVGTRLPKPARRRQLLGAAREVFVAQGYHAAAMDEIAERAGVSKPVLYQHFPGKLDLYLALLDQSCDTIIGACDEALSSTDDNKQRVTATVHVFYDYVANAQGAFRLVFESDLTNEPAVRERVERVTRECAEAIARVIHADTGRSYEQSRLLAVSLVGMAQVSARFWLDDPREIPQQDAATLVASLAWRGIRGFPRPATGPDPAPVGPSGYRACTGRHANARRSSGGGQDRGPARQPGAGHRQRAGR